MSGGGSKKGERRGGRKKGVPNKANIERALLAERELIGAKAAGKKLAKEVLDDFMQLFKGIAETYYAVLPGAPIPKSHSRNEAMFEKYAKLTVDTAKALATYQSPTFRAIQVIAPPGPDKPPQIGDGNVIRLDDPDALMRVYKRRIASVA